MLEIRNLKKNFGQLEILRGIDLSVEQGDVVAILGPSGSGKTTFLRCINFLERATDGNLTFDGKTFRRRIFCACGRKPRLYSRITTCSSIRPPCKT